MLLVFPLVRAPGRQGPPRDQGQPLPPLASGVVQGLECRRPLVWRLGSYPLSRAEWAEVGRARIWQMEIFPLKTLTMFNFTFS